MTSEDIVDIFLADSGAYILTEVFHGFDSYIGRVVKIGEDGKRTVAFSASFYDKDKAAAYTRSVALRLVSESGIEYMEVIK